MTTHTPGPWQAVSQGTQHLVAQKCDEEFRFAIAKVWEQTYHPSGGAKAEAQANARLIAAAPDLLDALQSLLNIEGAATHGARFVPAWKGLDVKPHFDKARAAIARATGADHA